MFLGDKCGQESCGTKGYEKNEGDMQAAMHHEHLEKLFSD